MMQFADNVTLVPPHKLRPNPINKEIHADIDPRGADAELFAHILKFGILEPITVFPNWTICAGHRRWQLATLAKLPTIPVIVLKTDNEVEAYRGTLLARRVSIYAMCVAYREQIEDYLGRGLGIKVQNAAKDEAAIESRRAASEKLEADWSRTESVTGLDRRSLTRGVKLLQQLEHMAQAGDFPQREHSEKVRTTFRNRGLKPARRLFGEKDVEDSDDGELDCGEWGKEEDAADKPKRKRPTVKNAAKEVSGKNPSGTGTKTLADIGMEDEPPATVAFVQPHNHWSTEVARHLDAIEDLMRTHGAWTGPVIRAFSTIQIGAGLIEPPSVLRKSAA